MLLHSLRPAEGGGLVKRTYTLSDHPSIAMIDAERRLEPEPDDESEGWWRKLYSGRGRYYNTCLHWLAGHDATALCGEDLGLSRITTIPLKNRTIRYCAACVCAYLKRTGREAMEEHTGEE